MYTSIIGVALSAVLGTAPAMQSPSWQHDYRLARELGGRENKPLLVVIGSGTTDWAKLARPAAQDESINQVLRDSYVCLFVDTDTDTGLDLARLFTMSNGPGLVISDRSGQMQAFRYAGEMPAGELATTLTRHASTVSLTSTAVPSVSATAAQSVTNYQPYFGATPFGGACRT